jgi:hypothetical protein
MTASEGVSGPHRSSPGGPPGLFVGGLSGCVQSVALEKIRSEGESETAEIIEQLLVIIDAITLSAKPRTR